MAISSLEIFVGVTLLVSKSSAQVMPTNVAVNKTANQSSTFDYTDNYVTPPLTYRAEARLAVDGRDTKAYTAATCAVTDWFGDPACTNNPWWQVDLGSLYDVFNVTIYQRGAGEAPGQRNYGPLVVRVGDHVERPENRTKYTDRPVVSVPLSPSVTASTVNISITGCAILILCEVEVLAVRYDDKCKSNPCQNGGTCLSIGNSFTCTCVPGYTGVNCSQDVNECALNYCQNAATCVNTHGSYSCSCPEGYRGMNCSEDVNECMEGYCQNGATCTNSRGSYSCICAVGYTGRNCSADVDECKLNYCQNAATCVNTHGSYSCSCTVGYKGNNCSEDVNECMEGYCQNGATCTNSEGSYSCVCAVGFTGRNCSADVDECALGFCQNDANCMNSFGSYNCSCAAGFIGRNCSTEFSECASSPCSNYSSCVDGINTYTCECGTGYHGDTCSDPCSGGTFGSGCKQTCSPNCLDVEGRGGQYCDGTTGHCLAAGCKGNYDGLMCMTEKPSAGGTTGLIIGVVIAAVAVVIVIAVVIAVMWRRRRQLPKEKVQCFENRGMEDVSCRQNEEPAEEEEEELEEVMAVRGNAGDYYNTGDITIPSRISLEQLPGIVAACRNNKDHLKEEYMRLPQGLLHPHDVGMNKHNKQKNRYKNICAYDHSRVVLSTLPGDPHSDYINACYVDGYKMPKAFIASQGPTKINETDFVRMIWELDIETIAMVTNPTEMGKMKCVQYWNDAEERKFGKFKVLVDNVREKADITIRRLTIKPSDGPAKHVTHFLYEAWPDKDVPDSPWSLIDFRDKVMTSYNGNSPVLVHCSAGIGRTGTLIALDMALRQLEEEGVVDLFNIVLQIRQHRVGLVQTQDQYTFLHEAALVGLCCAGRVVPFDTFISDTIANDNSRIQAEFEALERGSTAFSAEDLSLATTGEALYANRDQDILPPKNNIVWLNTEVKDCSNYINAVFVPSYMEEKRYIVTQTPLPSTVVNFWRAVLEHDVKVIVTLDQTEPDLEDGVAEYVPSGQMPLTLGPLTLTPKQTEKKQGYVLNALDVKMGKNGPHRVQQFVVNSWPASEDVPYDPRQIISLTRVVLDCTPPLQGVILLHCRDGAQRSGLVCGLLALLERCDSDREVAVPYVVGVLKSIRPQAVRTQEQYAFLYSAMLSHVDSSQVYQNVPRPKSKAGGVASSDNVYNN